MSQNALNASHAQTLRHLAASRFYLPETLPSLDAEECWLSMQELLHHNELGLALDDAIELGELCGGPKEFWDELHCAAVNMGLHHQAGLLQARL